MDIALAGSVKCAEKKKIQERLSNWYICENIQVIPLQGGHI